MEIAIIGGGIGGLTTALMLHRAGFSCRIYESVGTLRELGVGINLLPHAVRELSEIGLLDGLHEIAVETSEEYGKTDDGSPIRTIFLLNLESGEKSEFKDTITNSGAFSPDGKLMVGAFEVESERTDIWEIDIKTQELTPIARHDQWDWLPTGLVGLGRSLNSRDVAFYQHDCTGFHYTRR